MAQKLATLKQSSPKESDSVRRLSRTQRGNPGEEGLEGNSKIPLPLWGEGEGNSWNKKLLGFIKMNMTIGWQIWNVGMGSMCVTILPGVSGLGW